MLNRLSYYIDELRRDDKIDYNVYLNLREMSDKLGDENAALRKKLEKAATFTLDICSEDDCAGDSSVGLPPCPMWHKWDTDGNGVNIESGCYLKEYLTELKGEKNGTF